MVMSHQVGAGYRTWVHCKSSSVCSATKPSFQPLELLFFLNKELCIVSLNWAHNYAAHPVGALCFPETFSTCSSLPQTVCLLAPLAYFLPYFCRAALLKSPHWLLGACLLPVRDPVSMHTCVFTCWTSVYGFFANDPTFSWNLGLYS